MEGSSARYNMPGAYVIEGQIDQNALVRAVGTVLQRHEALRTRFVVRDGEPRQVVDALNVEGMEFAGPTSSTAYLAFRAPLENPLYDGSMAAAG